MRLQTSITPRKDGTVRVTGADGALFTFAAGDDGELCCDVTDHVTVAKLLATHNFWPAHAADMDAAIALVASPDDEAEDADDHDDDAAPVEANTEPRKKRAYTRRSKGE